MLKWTDRLPYGVHIALRARCNPHFNEINLDLVIPDAGDHRHRKMNSITNRLFYPLILRMCKEAAWDHACILNRLRVSYGQVVA